MKARLIWGYSAAAAALLPVIACGSGSSGGAAQGGVGQACYPNGTCNAGLSCYSNLCVDANVDGGSDGGGTHDSSVGGDSGVAADSGTSLGDSATTVADSGGGDAGGGDAGGGATGADAGAAGCTSYAASTVASMRKGHASGCFHLDAVAALGVTPGPQYRLFVQDQGGGSYSAMRTTCSASSATHPCTVGTTVGSLAGLQTHWVTLEGSYVYTAATMAEDFYIDAATNIVVGSLPAPTTLGDVAGVQPSAFTLDIAYQRVTFGADAGNELGMVDWSPAQFAVASASSCPYQTGFAVAPISNCNCQGVACTSTTSQPPSSPASAAVLIGTDFLTGFTLTTDCRCATMSARTLIAAGTRFSSLSGIAVWDVPASGTGFWYVAPRSNSDMPAM